ncbi:Glyoxalase I [Carpediemonas membranifera]|uniref:Glyoxalase I n=1 Tax=Carpediemonas membranifera TaxID=201153 RepID=A0A8J6BAA2_9EUKA|nr:Glyoxalase I [Carpediemonas membranifera]|eukprot:KAG9396002.1 Glyoxalase I [Carpediemonas membranifera]
MSATGTGFLHTMVRVKDLDTSIAFYEKIGMKKLRTKDFPQYKFTLVFLGFGDGPELELTYNYGREEPYALGEGYGHIAISVNNIHDMIARLKETDPDRIVREPYTMGQSLIAFITDPDGYKIELIEKELKL